MPFGLLKYGLGRTYPARRDIPPTPDLKPSYDVVIIGGLVLWGKAVRADEN